MNWEGWPQIPINCLNYNSTLRTIQVFFFVLFHEAGEKGEQQQFNYDEMSWLIALNCYCAPCWVGCETKATNDVRT